MTVSLLGVSVRIEEVAGRAGVAVSTVSRALRDLPGVSSGTRDRIKAIAAEVGYVASPSASRLATGVTGTVAVVVPDATKWFFGQVIAGAGAALRAAGRDVLLYELGDEEGRNRFFAEQRLHGRADAVLVLSLQLTAAETRTLRDLEVPVVVLGRRSEYFCSVLVDDRAAARTAVRHLLNLGHRRIGLIGINDDAEVTTGSLAPPSRIAGYRQSLLAAGIQVEEGWQQFETNSVAGGAAAMTRMLSAQVLPTAVFAASDEMAFGALGVVRAAGMSVPGDISFVGFDNHDLSPVLELTTIDQDVRGQGQAAAGLLLDALRSDSPAWPSPTTRSVETHLVLRRSTRPPGSTRTGSATDPDKEED